MIDRAAQNEVLTILFDRLEGSYADGIGLFETLVNLRDYLRGMMHHARDNGDKMRQFATGLIYDAVLFTSHPSKVSVEAIRQFVPILTADEVGPDDLAAIRKTLVISGWNLNPEIHGSDCQD